MALYVRHAELALPFWLFALAMLALQLSGLFLPLPEAPSALATMSLVNYFTFAAVAAALERKWGSRGESGKSK